MMRFGNPLMFFCEKGGALFGSKIVVEAGIAMGEVVFLETLLVEFAGRSSEVSAPPLIETQVWMTHPLGERCHHVSAC